MTLLFSCAAADVFPVDLFTSCAAVEETQNTYVGSVTPSRDNKYTNAHIGVHTHAFVLPTDARLTPKVGKGAPKESYENPQHFIVYEH
jgi:hypothetical protein